MCLAVAEHTVHPGSHRLSFPTVGVSLPAPPIVFFSISLLFPSILASLPMQAACDSGAVPTPGCDCARHMQCDKSG
jgi:hypothetical protein